MKDSYRCGDSISILLNLKIRIMNIRQLRAGNLVTTIETPRIDKELCIYRVSKTIINRESATIETSLDGNYYRTSVKIDNIFPIRIKRDMLDSMGFKLDCGVYCMDLKDMSLGYFSSISLIFNIIPNFTLVINGRIDQFLRLCQILASVAEPNI